MDTSVLNSNLLSGLGGIIIGVLLKPLEVRLTRKSEVKVAKREVYLELAEYFADIERAANGGNGYEVWEKARHAPPKFPGFDWYRSNRFDLLSRMDPKRGIRLLHSSMLEEYERGKKNKHSSSLACIAPDLLKIYKDDLDMELLQRYIADVNKRRSKSSALAA